MLFTNIENKGLGLWSGPSVLIIICMKIYDVHVTLQANVDSGQCNTQYKTPLLRNLCFKLCHVYVPEWRPRQQCFSLSYSIMKLYKKKNAKYSVSGETP